MVRGRRLVPRTTPLADPTLAPPAPAHLALTPRVLLAALRPRQWTKNLLVFIGLIFALRLAYPDLVARATLACIAFCVLSSAGYLVNDVADAAADRLHPVKRLRPVASGALSAPAALALAALLALGGMALAFSLGAGFAAVALLY